MEQLRESDLRGALELVGACESAPDLTSFGHALLGVARLVPGAVAFNDLDLARGIATVVKDPDYEGSSASAAEFARLAHQNPLIVHGRPGRAGVISDLLSARSFRALEFYDVVFAPCDFADQIALHLRAPSERVVGVAINRDRRGFSPRDRALLELLAPHLSRAHAHVLERTRARALRDLAARGLAEQDAASLLLGPRGEVESSDGRVDELLRRHFPDEYRPGHLPERLREWACGDGCSESFSHDDGRGRRLSATRLASAEEPIWRLILLHEWGPGPTLGKLRALGLTPREAEVLAWVARGKTDAEIGLLLGISPRTVDKHLENVFRKLEVSSRAAAVARATAAR
jgi:DNA-binding CsgD family transcriptional regulator